MLGRIIHRLKSIFWRKINEKRFLKEMAAGLPTELHDLMLFSYRKKQKGADRKLGNMVERLRASVVDRNDGQKVKTFGSPHSNTDLFDENGEVIPGGYGDHDIQGVAKTGTSSFGGIQLKRIVDVFGPGDVIELGTNTGLSGCYFLSSKNTECLVTIEGSPDLCRIADSNLKEIGSNYELLNCLFDDAISQMEKTGRRFSYAFIDGQHEKRATLHYMERLFPLMKEGGIIIFDDVYWSEDMNEAWKEVKADSRFDLCLDFGWRGICRLNQSDSQNSEKLFFDLTKYHGVPRIQRPGW